MSHNGRASWKFFQVVGHEIMSERHHVLLATALFLTGVGNAACSAAGDSSSPLGADGGTSGGGGTNGSGTGGTGAIIDPNQGGTGMKDPNDTRDVPVRKKTCDANGMNCTCLRLALLGTLDSLANQKDTQPFVDWLNGNSGGSATVTMVTTKPTLDGTFLGGFDVLVVANVNGWTFSADEKAAVEAWVRTTGGGIITLTGFTSMDPEPQMTSQLIEFAGFHYGTPTTAMNGQQQPVYFKGGTTDLKNCLAWPSSNEAIITTPEPFIPQQGSMAKLTLALDYVGSFIGWTVTGPANATIVVNDAISHTPIGQALEVDGKGRIFVWGDEWVIFKNQWEKPTGNPYNTNQDANNPCWHPADASGPGYFHSVATLYQSKQFWFNAVNWVAPPNECNFIINDPDVVVR
jgi:hypothetical protein